MLLHDLFGSADVRPVVVSNGVVLHAPGQLDLGRTSRLANRSQRRALRALYSTCAVPGCAARYDLCRLHHVVWWEHGGADRPLEPRYRSARGTITRSTTRAGTWRSAPAASSPITFPDGTPTGDGPSRSGQAEAQPAVLAVAS